MADVPQKVLKHMFKAELHVKSLDFAGACYALNRYAPLNHEEVQPFSVFTSHGTYAISKTKAGTWKVIQE